MLTETSRIAGHRLQLPSFDPSGFEPISTSISSAPVLQPGTFSKLAEGLKQGAPSRSTTSLYRRRLRSLLETKRTVLCLRPVASLACVLMLAGFVTVDAAAESLDDVAGLTGRQVMERVDERPEGEWVTRRLRMELTDRRGRTRTRDTVGYRRYYGKERRSVLFYTAPANIKDTAFLTWDYPEADRDDDQWLYLPAVRKIRRVSSSDRGDYFLGTDLTFEDLKREGKGNLEEFEHERKTVEEVDGVSCIVVEGLPISDEIARELGYGRVLSYVDPETWMIRRSEFWDPNGNPLKTIHSEGIEEIDGFWTATRIHVQNHKTGHQTRLIFTEVDYVTAVDDSWFETSRLRRGL